MENTRLKIKELRELKNISQETLAMKIKTHQRNIGRWENGENEPSYTQLISIADFFDVSMDYLVGRTEERQTYFSFKKTKTQILEEKLLKYFNYLEDDEKEKIINDCQYFYNKHTKINKKENSK